MVSVYLDTVLEHISANLRGVPDLEEACSSIEDCNVLVKTSMEDEMRNTPIGGSDILPDVRISPFEGQRIHSGLKA